MSHPHNALDVQPGTVTLCVEDGRTWAHTPVDADLWERAGEELRETFRGIARRQLGDDSLAVEVVRQSSE